MTAPTRDEIAIKLNAIDTALESPESDKAAILQDANAWLSAHPVRDVADSTYYTDRLQVIRQRHGV